MIETWVPNVKIIILPFVLGFLLKHMIKHGEIFKYFQKIDIIFHSIVLIKEKKIMTLPSDITNIILDYYSQLRDMKWRPFIDPSSGKLSWKVNQYSTQYDNIHKLLKHRKDHLRETINIHVDMIFSREEIDLYNVSGTCICLSTKYEVTKYKLIISQSYFYIEYEYDNSRYTTFCSKNYGITNNIFDVYQDNYLFCSLNQLFKIDNSNYRLFLEKY